MRELVDSSESISEPLRWFLARSNSSSLTGDSFRSRNSFTIRSITWPTVSRAVPAYTVIIPASEYGVNSLNTAYARPNFSRMFWKRREDMPPPNKIINHRNAKSPLMRERIGRHAHADMHLLEIALRFQVDRSFGGRRGMVFHFSIGLHSTEFALHQIQHFFVGHVAGGGNHNAVRCEQIGRASCRERV